MASNLPPPTVCATHEGTDLLQGATPKPLQLPAHLALVRKAGSGAYGEVYVCDDFQCLDSSGCPRQVAVKVVRNFTKDLINGKRILREIRILASLRHENLMRLIDLPPVPNPDFDDVYMVMPYMHADLFHVIYSKMKVTEAHCQAFTCQILRGVKYLHSAEIVHRDLKPSNILVNKDCTLRIADFGLARGLAREAEVLTDYVVTRWYRAPELLLVPTDYSQAVDLWSVGCIHMELLAREPLFPGKDHSDMLRRIAKTLGLSAAQDLSWAPQSTMEEVQCLLERLQLPAEPTQSLEALVPGASKTCLDFVRRLLEKAPARRISAAEAIAHEYIAALHDDAGETTARQPFSWDFDRFDLTTQALKDRVYIECARLHPDITKRDAKWLSARGFKARPAGA